MNAGKQNKVVLVIDVEFDWLGNQSECLSAQLFQSQSLEIQMADSMASAVRICDRTFVQAVVIDSLQLGLVGGDAEPEFLQTLPLIIVSAGQRSAVTFTNRLSRSCFSLRKSSCVELLPCFIKLASSLRESRQSRPPIKPPKMVFPSVGNGTTPLSSSIHTLY
jgi:DNA-binding NtrC family response regulator